MVDSKKQPHVIVLILTYNGKHLLEDSLSSYMENNYSNFHIVVIDNGSIDGTKAYVEDNYPEVSLIRLENNRGYSGGFNFGLEHAINNLNADYVLVTNDDVVADSNLVSELVKVAETDSDIGFVTGKVYFSDVNGNKNILQTVGKKSDSISIVGDHIGGKEEDEGQYDRIEERDFIDDVFTLVRREVIEETKGYDLNFFLQYEEADWQLRSRHLGYKIYFTPYAKLWHKVGMSTGGSESPLRHFNSKRNQILLVERHGSDTQRLVFLLRRIFYSLPIWLVRYTVRVRPDLIIATFAGTISGLLWLVKQD